LSSSPQQSLPSLAKDRSSSIMRTPSPVFASPSGEYTGSAGSSAGIVSASPRSARSGRRMSAPQILRRLFSSSPGRAGVADMQEDIPQQQIEFVQPDDLNASTQPSVNLPIEQPESLHAQGQCVLAQSISAPASATICAPPLSACKATSTSDQRRRLPVLVTSSSSPGVSDSTRALALPVCSLSSMGAQGVVAFPQSRSASPTTRTWNLQVSSSGALNVSRRGSLMTSGQSSQERI